MPVYVTTAGTRYRAKDAAALVRQMRRDAYGAHNDVDFMRDMAARAKLQNGADIPTDDVDSFVAALISAQLLTEDPNDDY